MLPEVGVRELSNTNYDSGNCLWGLSKLKVLNADYFLKCFVYIEMKVNETVSDGKSVAQIMESLRRMDRDSLTRGNICFKIANYISNKLT